MLRKLSVSIACLVALHLACCAPALDLKYTEITTVTDETRYVVRCPGKELNVFNKVRHAKGSYVFLRGDRIGGDRLIVTNYDTTQFTKADDVEVFMNYPAKGREGATVTAVEIYADLSSETVDAFFTDGGIGHNFADILIACNSTQHFTYEIFIYGY